MPQTLTTHLTQPPIFTPHRCHKIHPPKPVTPFAWCRCTSLVPSDGINAELPASRGWPHNTSWAQWYDVWFLMFRRCTHNFINWSGLIMTFPWIRGFTYGFKPPLSQIVISLPVLIPWNAPLPPPSSRSGTHRRADTHNLSNKCIKKYVPAVGL